MRSESVLRALLFAVVIGLPSACKKDPAPTPSPPSATAPSTPAASASGATPSTPDAGEPGSGVGVVRLGAEASPGDELGYAVATAGERVVLSAFKRKGKTEESHPGSVWVFEQRGGKLERETELLAEGSQKLGNAIAFDGKLVLCGALYDQGRGPETGAAYVFSRDEKGWSKAQKLGAGDAKKDDAFGIGVALAAGTLVVSNSREEGGSLYTFERGETAFGAKQTLPFRHQNGPAEVVAAAGDLLVAGAPNSGKLSEQGVVVVYRRGKGGFAVAAELVESEAAESQHFGSSVAVAGTTLVATSEKQISVFSEDAGSWKESFRFTPPVTTGLADAALALTDERLAVGFHLVDAGRVLLYRKQDGGWKLERTVTAPDGKNEDWFGYSLALSRERLVVGAPLVAERTGAAYVLSF